MQPNPLVVAVENLDRRLSRVEQILPTLATKEDLKPVATKEDLREAVSKLATEEEVREEGEKSRRHMDVLHERLETQIKVFAEGHAALEQRDARQHADTLKNLAALDTRVMGLEARSPDRDR
jgi:hypothetical protein